MRTTLAVDPVRIAYSQARKVGLSREDAYDCALDFRLHLLRKPSAPLAEAAWVQQCAHNFACNFLRTQLRRQKREHDYQAHTVARTQVRREAVVSAPGPRTLTLRKSLWEQVFATLSQFTPDQQDLFVRYHVREQSLSEIASQTKRSLPALSQSLYHIHRRLARLLMAQGWSAEEAQRIGQASPLPTLPRA